MIFRKDLKDIKNITVQSGDMRTHYRRVSNSAFEESYSFTDPQYEVCSKCGEFISDENDKKEHKECRSTVADQFCVLSVVMDLLKEDKDNVAVFNEKEPDQCFICLNTER